MHKLKSLLKDAVLFDMTDLLNFPIRTGIQRVTHQLALHWPDDRPILPFRHIGADRILILPPEILIHTERHFSSGDDLVQRAALEHTGNANLYSEGFHRMMALSRRPLLEVDAVTAAREARAVLSIELSMDIEFYGQLAEAAPEKVFVLNYDYILWLNPEFNSEVDWTINDNLSEYISVLRKFPNQSFISTATRDNFIRYIDKSPDKARPIIVPGTDGLGVMRRQEIPAEAKFVVIGTIEPRKQHLRIMRAIEQVQAEGLDVSLTIIGKMGWLTPEDRRAFEQIIRGNRRVHWLDAPADDQLIAQLSSARASIFFSRTEGFGGPPVESLSLGVPVIVSDTTPSVLDLPNRGQIRVGPDDDEGLKTAIRFFADPANARSKQEEIADLALPTWRSFIVGISDWVDETAPMKGHPFTMRGRLDELSVGKLIATSPSLAHVLTEMFRTALLREPGSGEVAAWLDCAEAEGLDRYSLVARFLEEAGRQRPEAMSLFSSILGSGEVRNLPETEDEAAEAVIGAAERLFLLSDHRRVAERIYSDLHRRPAAPEEIDGLTAALAAGYPRGDSIIAALTCDEFKAKNPGIVVDDAVQARLLSMAPFELLSLLNSGTDLAFVEASYRILLRRSPDPGGRATYMGKLSNGAPRKAVLLDILLSVEAGKGGLDIDVVSSLIQVLAHERTGGPSPLPTIAEESGSFADMAASQLLALARLPPRPFETVLSEILQGNASDRTTVEVEKSRREIGRAAKLRALAGHLPLSSLGGIDVAARLDASVRTMEARHLLTEPNDAVFVDEAYQLVLGRRPDPSGRVNYLAHLEQGMKRLELLLDLLQSEEAAGRHGRETTQWIAARLAGAREAAPQRQELV